MRYELDPDRSTVTVHASSSVHPIETTVPVTGWIELSDEPGADSAAAIEVPLAGMRSGNRLLDREAERRLHIQRHPSVTGTLTHLSPVTEGADTHTGTGDLTFHGVTRQIGGELTITAGDDHSVLITGATEIDVTDFGVQPPSLVLLKVHASVRATLDAVARPADAQP